VKTKKQRFFSTTLTVQVPTKHFVVVVNFILLLSLISLRISLGISITFETSRQFQQFSFTWNSNNVFFSTFSSQKRQGAATRLVCRSFLYRNGMASFENGGSFLKITLSIYVNTGLIINQLIYKFYF
jgi:hypothetical protein